MDMSTNNCKPSRNGGETVKSVMHMEMETLPLKVNIVAAVVRPMATTWMHSKSVGHTHWCLLFNTNDKENCAFYWNYFVTFHMSVIGDTVF